MYVLLLTHHEETKVVNIPDKEMNLSREAVDRMISSRYLPISKLHSSDNKSTYNRWLLTNDEQTDDRIFSSQYFLYRQGGN